MSQEMQYCTQADAVEFGLEAAVILTKLAAWIRHNKANGRNARKGRTWSYNTRAALAEMFPFVKQRRLDNIIRKLVNDGVLLTGRFGKESHNRTLWYAFADETRWIDDGIKSNVHNPDDATSEIGTLEGTEIGTIERTESGPSTIQILKPNMRLKQEGGVQPTVPVSGGAEASPPAPPSEISISISEEAGWPSKHYEPDDAEKALIAPYAVAYRKAHREGIGEGYTWINSTDTLALARWCAKNPEITTEEFAACARWCFTEAKPYVMSKAVHLAEFCEQTNWQEYVKKYRAAAAKPKEDNGMRICENKNCKAEYLWNAGHPFCPDCESAGIGKRPERASITCPGCGKVYFGVVGRKYCGACMRKQAKGEPLPNDGPIEDEPTEQEVLNDGPADDADAYDPDPFEL